MHGEIRQSGNKIFSSQTGGEDDDYSESIAVDSTNGVYYIDCVTYSPTFDGVSLTGLENGDAFLLKFSTAGVKLPMHYQSASTNGIISFAGAAVDSEGNIWVVGGANEAYLTSNSNGGPDMLVQKFSPSGAPFSSTRSVAAPKKLVSRWPWIPATTRTAS
jgi:hypothetical protein